MKNSLLPLLVVLLLIAVCANAASTTLIHSFQSSEGLGPSGAVALFGGSIYGVSGGATGQGRAYRLYPKADGSYAFVALHDFSGSDGVIPFGAVAVDPSGNLFGTTVMGGTYGCGTLWELIRPPNLADQWSFNVIWQFTCGDFGGNDGGSPRNGVIYHLGSVYGTTPGSLFRAVQQTDGSYQFQAIAGQTMAAQGVPTFDSNGNVYAVALSPGAGLGQVYRYSLDAFGNWAATLVASIGSGAATDPQNPTGGVLVDSTGTFYGLSSKGGAYGGGTIFKIAAVNGSYVTTVVRAFDPTKENFAPMDLLLNIKKKYYGLLYSVPEVFQAYPGGASKSWTVNNLLNPAEQPYGYALSMLTPNGTGQLYTTTGDGGDLTQCGGAGCGAVWKITP